MKLYTEEEVKLIIERARIHTEMDWSNDDLMGLINEIEIPTDEEIIAQTKDFMFESNKEVFYNGAKWMREQILNQIK